MGCPFFNDAGEYMNMSKKFDKRKKKSSMTDLRRFIYTDEI